MNRKRRLKRGINSLEEQIQIHKEKLKKAEEEGLKELVGYYEKEIISKEKAMKHKKERMERKAQRKPL